MKSKRILENLRIFISDEKYRQYLDAIEGRVPPDSVNLPDCLWRAMERKPRSKAPNEWSFKTGVVLVNTYGKQDYQTFDRWTDLAEYLGCMDAAIRALVLRRRLIPYKKYPMGIFTIRRIYRYEIPLYIK